MYLQPSILPSLEPQLPYQLPSSVLERPTFYIRKIGKAK